jgi:hypothetical protein
MSLSPRAITPRAITPRRVLLLCVSLCLASCSVFSSSDDFVGAGDTAQDTATITTTEDTAADTTPEDLADTPSISDVADTDAGLPLGFLCGVLCSKLISCDNIPESINKIDKCGSVCEDSADNIGLGAQFQCWLSIFNAASERGADLTDFGNLDACPLLDVDLLKCDETIQCVTDCSDLEACGKPTLINCGFACIENVSLSTADSYFACTAPYRDDLAGFLAHDVATSPRPDIDAAAACLLADNNASSLDITCQDDPCVTLCDGISGLCDGHPARLSYGLPLSGPASPQSLSDCAQRCAARFPDASASIPFTAHADADTLACRLGYLALLAFDPTQPQTSCAYADLSGGGVCVDDPADIDADGLTGSADPCPYAANLTAEQCDTPDTYCSLASPNCDDDLQCNDLSVDSSHCGACGNACDGASPCDGHGVCAQACDANAASPCAAGSTCRDGYCLWCDATPDQPCPQGDLCDRVQCDTNQRCAFGVCVETISCGGSVCAPFETCDASTDTCQCGAISTNSCNPNKDICMGDECISSAVCDGVVCQPGEGCGVMGCECDTMRCASAEFCRPLPAPASCQPIVP